MFQQQPQKTSPHARTSPAAPPGWASLVEDLLGEKGQKRNAVPERVATAIARVEQLTARPELPGDRAEISRTVNVLAEYRDTVRDAEHRGFRLAVMAPKYPSALFDFLDSPRLLTDFAAFCDTARLSPGCYMLRWELFAGHAVPMIREARATLRGGTPHRLSDFLLQTLEDTIRFVDSEAAGAALVFFAELHTIGAIPDCSGMAKALARTDLPWPSLLSAAEATLQLPPEPCLDDARTLFLLGSRAACCAPAATHWEQDSISRSHPIVQCGYLAQLLAHTLSSPPSGPRYSLAARVFSLLPEYFVYMDPLLLQDLIPDLQEKALFAVRHFAPRSFAAEAREILQQPWGPERIRRLFSTCERGARSRPASTSSLLGVALESPEIVDELRSEVRRRALSPFEEYQASLRSFGRALAQVIQHEQRLGDREKVLVHACALLDESAAAAAAALQGLLRLAGIKAISLGPLGPLPVPWGTRFQPTMSEAVRRAARQALRSVEPQLPWSTRFLLSWAGAFRSPD